MHVGTTTEEIAASISPGLQKESISRKVNGQLIDLKTPIEEDGTIAIITPDAQKKRLEILRHSTAHLIAQALKRLYKDVKLWNWSSD